MNVPSTAGAARAASPVPAAGDVPPEHAPRPERNPMFRGWCYWCGTPIYPSSHNFYCRSCAALMAKGWH